MDETMTNKGSKGKLDGETLMGEARTARNRKWRKVR